LLSRQAGYRKGGIHNYIQQLIDHLPMADPALRVTIFTGRIPEELRKLRPGLCWETSRWPTEHPLVRIVWEQLVQPWALWRAGVALLHALAFVSPVGVLTPAVVSMT
jgi:hypothetical protein